MNPWPVEAEVPEVHLPRPGHADLAGVQKYGFTDVRNVLERAQRPRDGRARGGRRARQGVPARARRRGRLARHPDRLGARARARPALALARLRRRRRVAGALPRRRRARRRWSRRSTCCARRNESLGGVFEVRAFGLVPGLGSHVSWEERLDGRLGDGDALDPGDEGRRDRRRLRPRRAARLARRTTRSSTPTSAATTARPTAPAASRAA